MLGWLLALSLVGLALGPVLVLAGRGRRAIGAAVDGFTIGVVPALIAIRLLPHTFEALRGNALLLALGGYVLVSLSHRGGHGVERRVGRAVVVPTLFVHAIADGAALALTARGPDMRSSWLLAAALILHRLPEGLFVATALGEPANAGARRLVIPVAILGSGTLFGALFGASVLGAVPERVVDGLVAFGLGAMIRLVVHAHEVPTERRARSVSGVAFLVGIAIVLAIPDPESVLTRAQPRELSMVQSLIPLFVETAPSMLIGLVAAGALHAFAPRKLSAWLSAPTKLQQASRGMVFGLPLPVCTCGVVPMARKLLVLGAPPSAVVAFAVATPELGVDSAFLSFRLLGVPLTVARLITSAFVAIAVALLVAKVARRPEDSSSLASFGPPPEPIPDLRPAGFAARARNAASEGFGEALDHVGAWYLFGLLLAAAFEASVDPSSLSRIGAPFDVVLGAAVAVPLYVCAQGATPLAAMMVHKGFSVGAALAFLLVGPATNIAILALVRRELGNRAAVLFAAASVAIAVVFGMAINAFVAPSSLPDLHPLVAHQHHLLEWIAAVILVTLLVLSILRLGPRAWLSTMTADHFAHDPTVTRDDAHADCGHAHEEGACANEPR